MEKHLAGPTPELKITIRDDGDTLTVTIPQMRMEYEAPWPIWSNFLWGLTIFGLMLWMYLNTSFVPYDPHWALFSLVVFGGFGVLMMIFCVGVAIYRHLAGPPKPKYAACVYTFTRDCLRIDGGVDLPYCQDWEPFIAEPCPDTLTAREGNMAVNIPVDFRNMYPDEDDAYDCVELICETEADAEELFAEIHRFLTLTRTQEQQPGT